MEKNLKTGSTIVKIPLVFTLPNVEQQQEYFTFNFNKLTEFKFFLVF
jgi:hypothetical protein